MDTLRIGLLGLGTVGTGTVRLLQAHERLLWEKTGVRLQLVRIADLDLARDRGLALSSVELTQDAHAVAVARDIDVVVELIGGIKPARELVELALRHGKHVVTANKALIARYGNELLSEAETQGCDLAFEAAVAGAVPIIRALRESLAANRIDQVHGILNGTCNYILTEMREKALPFQQVLKSAQEMGYAEADPSFDVDGIDTAHKLAILSAIAFGTPVDFSSISIEGIRHVTEVDIGWAKKMGYRIKLLAIAKRNGPGLELRVHPAMVTTDSMVATVDGVFNAVFVNGDFSGTTMYFGRGAGEKPTASAVVSDLMEIARNVKAGARRRVPSLSTRTEHRHPLPIVSMNDLVGEYYLRLAVVDQSGVLAEIADVFRRHGISIKTIHQEGRSTQASVPVPLVLVTHETTEKQVRAGLQELESLGSVREKPHLIRIESILA
ncbi:MAG: homoserine dehydrogenase [Magnetococcales bacterium]|nr:homoserine dehydrogenase [Magnetococcales bacterium]